MKPFLRTDKGAWFVTDDPSDVKVITDLSRTGFGFGYGAEEGRRSRGGLPQDFYVLVCDDGLIHVVARAENAETAGRMNISDGNLVIGFHLADPYPDHGDDIAALSAAIGVDLSPRSYYAGLWELGHGNPIRYSFTDRPGRDGQWLERLNADEQAVVEAAIEAWIGDRQKDAVAAPHPEQGMLDAIMQKAPIGITKVIQSGLRTIVSGNREADERLWSNCYESARNSLYRLKGKALLRSFDEPTAAPAP